jgi:NAD(P)-dependent dehydrogenase (short-subunit alcohol dehydrogenase family)
MIVGASSGIGAALAVEYARHSATGAIVLAARRVPRLEEVAGQCAQVETLVQRCDVTVQSDCAELVSACLSEFGRLDVCIYCVGIAMHVRFADISDLDAVMGLVMGTNFTGAVYTTYAVQRALKASNGRLAMISSVAGELSPPFLTFYCAAKHALNSFCESLRLESPGFSVSVLAPGYVESEIDDKKVVGDGSVQPVALNVDRSKYMPAAKAAKLIRSAVVSRKKHFHLTAAGSLGATLRAFMPGTIDSAIRREMESINVDKQEQEQQEQEQHDDEEEESEEDNE